ncbi:HlyD family secretion protein [Chitinophaga tropicalis]|uniref:HlyD family efflux transporter periplasmic adaptor subunit n=1 Tax=Chitinophaga tropicalis TaxID=2683588 RepID=A0A7K1U334_9BACT|nr:HlyD family secretion protein [Chitinophaga tropicalis]MVT08415.1 HlyD family efflux transporter periplasmic adaptor subunit [Chitinophaga tropicalis]
MKAIHTYFILSAVSLLIAACSGESTDNAQLEADISPIIPKVSSTVVDIRVVDNQHVKKGDTLLVLDDAAFRIAVQQSEVVLEQAMQNVKVASINSTSAGVSVSNVTASSGAVSANLASSEAAVESAKAQLSVAEKNYERYAQLLEQKSATQQQFDKVKADRVDAEARLQTAIGQRNAQLKQIDASKYQVENARSQFSGTQASVGLAELAVKKAQADLDAAKLQFSYCTILAPVDGVISKKNAQVGQVVSVVTPLMAIANDKQVWVVANFKETQLKKMHAGQEAEIEVDAYPDTIFTGTVQSLAQATGAKFSFLPADNATGNFVKVTQRVPVKIVIAENHSQKYPLRAGMSVYVKVKTN